MATNKEIFQFDEMELRVLCTYLLSLPLPPLLAGEAGTAAGEEEMSAAVGSLRARGWLRASQSRAGALEVDPGLVEVLRAAAYHRQMSAVSWHRPGEPVHRLAFYRWEENTVEHKLLPGGEHRFRMADTPDMGHSLVAELLSQAEEGQDGPRVLISREGWQSLFASRVAGNPAALKQALTAAAADDPAFNERLEFSEDTLDASLVAEVRCVYDSLGDRKERAVFVLGEQRNWLLADSAAVEDEDWMWAICAPRQALARASAALFAPLTLEHQKARSS